MKYQGPMGMPRPLGLGPMAQETGREFNQDVTRQEFIEACMEGPAADEYSRDFIVGIVGEDMANRIQNDDLDEDLKRKWCEGIANVAMS